ncbi:hypothetical protein RJ641_030356 [Dillenia turbinata]|uniref:Uncharacterized protein n=1 Tax=Dillenia turbinata TaxID=194707 RepID=A0AAN8VVI7_9MAGN
MGRGRRPGPSGKKDGAPPVLAVERIEERFLFLENFLFDVSVIALTMQIEDSNTTIEDVANAKRLKTQSLTPSLLPPQNKVTKNPKPSRRSERIQNLSKSTPNEDIEPVTLIDELEPVTIIDEVEPVTLIDEVYTSGNDKENEPQHSEERKLPESNLDNRSLVEKVQSLVRRLQEQEKTVEELKSKVLKRSSRNQTPCAAEITYKSLYVASQKKVEALTDENIQLSKKLEYALGKLEAYEKGNCVLSDAMERVKDVMVISNLWKTTGMALNLSSQAMMGGHSSPDPAADPKT